MSSQSSLSKSQLKAAKRCPQGHLIEKRKEGLKWFQLQSRVQGKHCDVCGKDVEVWETRWRCNSKCDYDVCNSCFQLATKSKADEDEDSPEAAAPALELTGASRRLPVPGLPVPGVGAVPSLSPRDGGGISHRPTLARLLTPRDGGGGEGASPRPSLPARLSLAPVKSRPKKARGGAAREGSVSLTVRWGEAERLWTFQGGAGSSSLHEQIAEICEELSAPPDEDCGYESYDLIRRHGTEVFVFNSVTQLLSLLSSSVVSLERAEDFLKRQLEAVRAATPAKKAECLSPLMAVLPSMGGLAAEDVRETVLVLVDAATVGTAEGTVELAMSCFCSLFRDETCFLEAIRVLEEEWARVGVGLFEKMLLALFPEDPKAVRDDAMAPRATLSVFLLLLRLIDASAAAAHASAIASASGSTGYQRAILAESYAYLDDLQDFRLDAARLVLARMLQASTRCDAGLQKEMQTSIYEHKVTFDTLILEGEDGADSVGDDAKAWLLELLEDTCDTELFTTSGACTDTAPMAELRWLRSEIVPHLHLALQKETKTLSYFQSELRQAKTAISGLVPFVQVPDSRIQDMLPQIVCSGWDSMDWGDSGETLLHYSCKAGCPPPVVDLIAGFCTDLEALDSAGKRAADYALDPASTAIIERHLQERAGKGQARTVADLAAARVQLGSPPATPTAPAHGGGPPGVDGPLSEEQLATYWSRFCGEGRDVVRTALRNDASLSEADADLGVRQLEMIRRVVASAPAAQTAPSAVHPPMPGKGKGKGPPAPGGAPGSEAAADALPSQDGAPGKGSPPGKGGGPPGKGDKGKGKGKGVEPTKPDVTPGKSMKSVQWTRYLMDAQLQKGESVWDDRSLSYEAATRMVPAAEIEERFSKVVGAKPVAKEEEKTEKAKALRIPSIANDARFQIEVLLKGLPPEVNNSTKAARAIMDMDSEAISPEVLRSLASLLCPNADQEAELSAKRLEEGTFDKVEEFMEGIAKQVPASKLRLGCWEFQRSLGEQLETQEIAVKRFRGMVDSFRNSEALPSLLGLVLAFGNYLNGGNSRLSRADGFHIETLGRPGGLDTVNDVKGKNIRQLIFGVFIDQCPREAKQVLIDLAPLFSIVSRKLGKDEEGVERLAKDVRVKIEDINKEIARLGRDYDDKQKALKEVLRLTPDPADKFKVEMPSEYQLAKARLDAVHVDAKEAEQRFSALISYFKAEKFKGEKKVEDMTSEVWCQIWDDFFVPRNLIERSNDKIKKEVMMPRFCKGEPLDLVSLEILWDLKASEDKPAKSVTGKLSGPPKRKGRGRKGSQDLSEIPVQKMASSSAFEFGPQAQASTRGRWKMVRSAARVVAVLRI